MGRPPKVKDKELKSAVENRSEIIITTSEVAEVCDVDRRTANKRLDEHPKLISEDHGRTKAWFLKDGDPIVPELPSPIVTDGGFNIAREFSMGIVERPEHYPTNRALFLDALGKFYPLRILPLAFLCGIVAGFFGSLLTGAVFLFGVYLLYPSVLLALIWVGVQTSELFEKGREVGQ